MENIAGAHPDWPVAVGGFLFGIGAALNGGCAFSTLTHLAMGNLGAGFALLSQKQIENAQYGIPVNMSFVGNGANYVVQGSVRRG